MARPALLKPDRLRAPAKVLRTLRLAGGNNSKTAKKLGIHRRLFFKKIREDGTNDLAA
jgi:ActR/RegA family two-component response regulator